MAGAAAAALGVLTAASGTTAAIPGDVIATPRLKPPAPGPRWISRNDLERIALVRDDIERRNFARARQTAATLEDPTARSLALWYYHYANDPDAKFDEIAAFLQTHPDWPARSRIQRHGEARMPSDTAPGVVVDFFSTAAPQTADGIIALGAALFAVGEREAAVLHVREAWIDGRFTLRQEREFLARFGGNLTPDDHAARVDRLLWAREVTNARRVFRYLTPETRRLAEVRANLLVAASAGETAFERLSADARADSGVLLAAVRYYRRKGEDPRAIALARQAASDPTTVRDPGRWWDERQLLMRWALKNGLFADAYAMAAGHGIEPGDTDFSEAEFNAGWIALSYLDDPKAARVHFAALTASVGTPISLSRGYYWLGRAAEAENDAEAAAVYYDKAAGYAYSFYGQLAAEKIGGAAAAATFAPTPDATPEEKARFASRPAARALRMLTEVGDDRGFLIFSYYLDDQLESAGEYRELAELAADISAPHIAVRAGKAGVRGGLFPTDVLYPEISVPRDATAYAPPEMILGLSRQESEFNPRAFSRAGARGLMQLIPSTAEITARKERLPYRRAALLNDPTYNMTIGSAHLSHLLQDFNGAYPMVFAAYNAGPHRVRQWIREHGDPRDPAVDPIEWIERIPFSETRNYVQRVLENIQVYRARLTGAPLAGGLAKDLERGGRSGRVGTGMTWNATRLAETSFAGDRPPEVQARIRAIAAPVLAEARLGPHAAPVVADAAPAANAILEPKEAPGTQTPNSEAPTTTSEATPRAAPEPIEERAPTPPTREVDIETTPPAIAGPDAKPRRPAPTPTPTPTPTVTPTPSVAEPAVAAAPPPRETPPAATGTASPENGAVRAGSGGASSGTAGSGETGLGTTASADDCVGYAAFISEANEEEEAEVSAEDLNAGALAELRSGGPAC
ncbi:MAG: transglycosylase SLT domain-containing protein [Parvularculaceae bacterium]